MSAWLSAITEYGWLFTTILLPVALVVFRDSIDDLILSIHFGRLAVPRTLSGFWVSCYSYQSSVPGSVKQQSFHIVRIKQSGSRFKARSLKHSNGNKLILRGKIFPNHTITAEWNEFTSRKRNYFGVIHLKISPTRDDMNGKWLGFDRNANINVDEWEMRLVKTRKEIRHFKKLARKNILTEAEISKYI
jgi:hypothetical protein